jgi:hypothetical protein
MSSLVNDEPLKLPDDTTILVEFPPEPGMRQVSITQFDLPQKSAEAVNKAMESIRQMAQRTILTIDALTNKPSLVELEFGIKLSTQAGALIAKTSGEGNIKVKLVWQRQETVIEQISQDASE